MANSIDSLEIKLSADASKAAASLEKLKDALSGLNTALAPAAKGLDSMVLSLSKVVGMQSGLTNISKTFGSLAKSWTALNQSTNKSAAEMAGISDKARTMSQVFAKEYGIKGKESVSELTNAFQKLYSSIGDNAAMGKALGTIDTLIRDLGRIKTEGLEAGNVIREMLQSTTVKLPSSVTKELGSNLINYMSKLSHVSGTEGALPSEIVKEINAALDPNRMLGGDKDYSAGFIDITGLDNEVQILQRLVDALRAAENQTISFREAANQDQDVINQLDQKLENLAASVGTTMKGSMESYIDAMRQVHEVSPALASQLMSLDTTIENIANNGNPFEGVLSGLTQLQDIHLSDSLNNLTAVKDAMGKFGGENATRAAANLPGIASALRQFDGVTIPPIGEDVMNLAAGLSKLGGKKIADGFTNLENIKASLTGINGLKIDPAVTQSIYQLAEGLYKFGLAKMDKAVSTIPALAGSISQLVNSLSKLPAVSENTIRLISALGNVNVHASNAANAVGGRLSRGLKLYTGNAFNARKASMSLAQAFGKMYANFFIFFRLARQFKNDIDLASDLTEVQNVVDVTFGDMADKMNEFSKAAIDSLGMSELTAKRVGSRFQAMGTAMSISDSMIKSTNDFVQTATNGYADVADSMADVSINLTRLAGDMASFYNADYADVAEDLEAIYTGLSKPLRKYGIDLSQASLSAWALNHGMEANFKTMTQAEKTLLRYQYVMAQTAAAHGDFERTQSTWANQIRIATERLNQLRIVLGKIAIYTFKPLVQSFNKAMEQIIKGAEGLLNALGKIFGWQIEWNDGGILNDEADDAEDLADNMGDAADNAKKFKNFLLGIDELNVLPSNDDKDKGKGSDVGDLGKLGEAVGGFNIKPIESGFESLYDTLFKLGRKIADVIKNLLQSIDWDKVYKKARRFGRDIAEFLNGLLYDSQLFNEIGKFFANGINTIAHAIDAYSKEFNGWRWGVDLGELVNGFNENLDWAVIKSAAYERAHDIAQEINAAFFTIDWSGVGRTLAEGLNTAFLYFNTLATEIDWSRIGKSISETINSFFGTFDFEMAASTISNWASGILDLIIAALNGVNWNQVGKKIGDFLKKLNIKKIAGELSKVLIKVFNAGIDIFMSAFGSAPFETALITLFGLIKTNTLSPLVNVLFGDIIEKALKNVDTAYIVKELTGILGKALLGVGAGFAEFFTFKDTFRDLYLGIEDVGSALLKLGGIAVTAGGIMTAVFGFPAGTIAAGVIALTGEIVGIGSALIEVQEEADKLDFAKSISNDGVGIGEYISGVAGSMRNAYDDYNNLARELEKTDFSETEKNIKGNMKEIGLAIESLGTSLDNTKTTVADKLDAIEKLFEKFKNNVSSLFSEEIGVITDMGVNGLASNYGEVEAAAHDIEEAYNEQVVAVEMGIAELEEAFNNGEMSFDEFEGAMRNQFKKLNSIYGNIISEEISELEKTSSQIDFSKFFLGEETIDSVSASLEELSRVYENGVNDLSTNYEKYYEDLAKLGQQAKAAGLEDQANTVAKEIADSKVKEAELIQAANDEYINTIAKIETDAWDQIGEIIANPDHLSPSVVRSRVDNYVNTVLIPLEEAILKETDRVGIAWETGLGKTGRDLADNMNSVLSGMMVSGKDYEGDYKALWNEQYANAFKDMGTNIEGLSTKQSLAKDTAMEFADAQGAVTTSSEEANDTITELADEVEKTDSVLKPLAEDLHEVNEQVRVGAEIMRDTWLPIEKHLGTSAKNWGEFINMLKTGKVELDPSVFDALQDRFEKSGVSAKYAASLVKDLKDAQDEWTKKSEKDAKTSSASFGNIERAMLSVKDTSSFAFSNMADISKAVSEVGKSGEGINQISTSFSGLGTLIQGMAQNFTPIKTEFSTFTIDTQANMQKTTSIFGESFTSIMKYGNQTISWLKGSFVPYFSGAYWSGITSSIPNAFGNAFRQAINIMMNLWKQFATWANQNMKMKVNMRGKEVTGVDVEIPQYATGGFPEDGLFQANHGEMVGQFANGKTAVANNEQIVEGIRQGVYDAVKAAMAENGSGNVTVELAGDASDIFTAVVKENNRAIYRTGTSPIRN